MRFDFFYAFISMVIFLFLFAIQMCQGISKKNKNLPLKTKFLCCQATLVLNIRRECIKTKCPFLELFKTQLNKALRSLN